MAFWGKQTVLGAEMARDEINAGSERVVIVLGDHQLHAKNALSEYQKLTDLNNVDGIYIEFSLPSAAVAPVSALRKKPTIYSAAASSPLAASPMMYKSFLDYEAGCKQIGEYWRSLGLQKVGILKPNAEFGELCLEGMRKVYPDLFEQDFNPGDEMATQVLALRYAGAEAVVSSAFEPDLQRLLKSMQNIKWTPLVGAQRDLVTAEIIKKFPEYLDKLVAFSLPVLPPAFENAVRERDPSNTLASISAAGLGYLHVKQLYNAISSCPRDDSACIIKLIGAANPDQQTGFKGWKDRIAVFDFPLVTWVDGTAQVLAR